MASENAQEHHDKTASGEYEIPRPPNKPGGYSSLSNLGVYYNNLKLYAGLIILAYIVVDSICWWIRSKLRAIRSQELKQKHEAQYARENVEIKDAGSRNKTASGEDILDPATWGTEFKQKRAAKSVWDNIKPEEVWAQLEEKRIQDRRKWVRVRKGFGKPVVQPTTPNTAKPVAPPGSGIFMFGSAKKPASNKNVFRGTCSSIRRTVIKKTKNYLPSKDSNGIVAPKKRKTSKKLKRRNKHLKWLLEQKHRNPIRAIKLEGDRHQPTYRIREQSRKKICTM